MQSILDIKTDYLLQCQETKKTFRDDGFMLSSKPGVDSNYLLRTKYSSKKLNVGNDALGIYKFADWLPINRMLSGSSAPITYKSKHLAKHLGLKNLYITFSGFWPEKEAYMYTGTFKECEAYSVVARLPEDFEDVLVVASAGNTARAFARVCSENNVKLLLVVPDGRRKKLWFKEKLAPNVKLITVGGNSDYYDAITLANEMCKIDGFVSEGGAKNVARRDGMGTTVLSSITTIGEIPDFYFQAVGSGTGAIAAWEANIRFNESGDYEKKKMSLHVSQNFPFLPMYDAWRHKSRELLPLEEVKAKEQLSQIYADVLANRKPAFGIGGGLFDALKDTKGTVHCIMNEDAENAAALFEEKEGIDIEPAASVALASLVKCVENETVRKDAVVMLNITGGGISRFQNENKLVYLSPSLVVDNSQIGSKKIKDEVVTLFR